MYKRWILFMNICYGLTFSLGQSEELRPIFDGCYDDYLPANFRTTRNCASIQKEVYDLEEGLYNLPASGSGQFSEASFIGLVNALANPRLIIVDLRQESHGLINGQAISWTDGKYNWANVNRTLQEIEVDEQEKLKAVLDKGSLIVNSQTNPQQVLIQKTQTERELVESFGVEYVRIPVQDHCRPSDEIVDQFMSFILQVPKDYWVHFHCRAGRGRTTTFLTLYDMMLNASHVSLETILIRHKLMGGTDLFKTHEPDNYKHYPAIERLEFVKYFYEYCQKNPTFQISWSKWINKKENLS